MAISWRIHAILLISLLIISTATYLLFSYINPIPMANGKPLSVELHSITTDVAGNFITAGYIQSNATEKADVLVQKYTTSGQLAWSKTISGNGTDVATTVAIAPDNSIILGGWTSSKEFDNQSYDINGSSDLFVAKMSPTGNTQWLRVFGGGPAYYTENAYEMISGVSIAATGTIYVTGVTYAKDFLGGNYSLDYYSSSMTFILAYSPNGTLLWQHEYFSFWADGNEQVAVANDGLYLSSCENQGHFLYINNMTTSLSDSDANLTMELKDIRVTKLADNGTALWTKFYGGNAYDCSTGSVATSDGIYLAGSSRSTDFLPSSHGNLDYFVMKLLPNGSLSWGRMFGGLGIDGMDRDVHGVYVAVDNGTVYAAGSSFPYELLSSNKYRGQIYAFDQGGTALWNATISGNGNDIVMGLAANGRVAVAGWTDSTNLPFSGTATGLRIGMIAWVESGQVIGGRYI